jgi:hypothetical protein
MRLPRALRVAALLLPFALILVLLAAVTSERGTYFERGGTTLPF